MKFKKTARNVGRRYALGEIPAVETFTIMHELLAELISARITINMHSFFRISYTSTNFKDNIEIGENKKAVSRALTGNSNLYIRPETKLVSNASTERGSPTKNSNRNH